jgi:myo-inositol catabolism protein IolC
MPLGHPDPLYMLAFDHRGSFQKDLFGITGSPTDSDRERISDAKRVIFEGFERTVAEGAPRAAAGILVDEEYGTGIARDAGSQGFALAMPVEKSGQAEFDFEYGDAFRAHIEEFDPTFVKVLVRYNPEGDPEPNERQAGRLRELGDWLHEQRRKFLFELLVPAEPGQLEAVGGDRGRYDRELRPALVTAAIAALQGAGVEPDIWKIEGLDRRRDCEAAAEQARADGRDGVACIVLGRGASSEAVANWLEQAAGVPGYRGFAIGRTLWWSELQRYVAGELPREEAAGRISENYRRMIELYRAAAAT